MLIQCSRHTSNDLMIWKKYEEMDKINAEKLKNKIERALNCINDFCSTRNVYLGCSWGKDSVSILYLLWLTRINIPVINLRVKPNRNPYCDIIRDEFLKQYTIKDYREIEINYDNILNSNMIESDQNKATDKLWYATIRRCTKEIASSHILGIRKDESTGRRIRMFKYREASPNALAPIGFWTTNDVFAFLNKFNLPIHPNYAMLGGGRWDRNYIRVAEIGDIHGRGMGRLQWEKEYYEDILNQIGSKND